MAKHSEVEEVEEAEEVRWVVKDGSSEDEVHPATNVLQPEHYRLWQTETPTDDAWLILQPRPPTAFYKIEIVNAGSALVEIHGLREDADGDVEADYELLLSAQQVMSVKDLMSKSNRNRAFVYDIDSTRKLSPVAAQHKWKKIQVNCRQPFGTVEHRACIGLAYINFASCEPKVNKLLSSKDGIDAKAKSTAPTAKRKLPSWASSSEPETTNAKPQKKLRETLHQDAIKSEVNDVGGVDFKPVKSPSKQNKGGISFDNPDAKESGKDRGGKSEVLKIKSSKGEYCMSDPDHHVRDKTAGKHKNGGSHTKSRTPVEKDNVNITQLKEAKVDKESSHKSGPPATNYIDDMKAKNQTKDRTKVAEQAAAMKNRKHDSSQVVDAGLDAVQKLGRGYDDHDKIDVTEAQRVTSRQKGHLSGEERERDGKLKVEDVTGLSPGKKNVMEQDFTKLLDGVVFAISGIQNPERGELRSKGLEMGARYCPDWTSDCTLLVCAYMDTPKFKQVKADGGTIVSKDWIPECHKQQKLVDIDRFIMNKGKPWHLSGGISQRKSIAEDKKKAESPAGKNVSCGSVTEIQNWVHEDLTSTICWLQQQDAKPEPEELESTAAQGILVCLDDAIKSLQEKQGISSISESWGFLPRVVKELAAMEEGNEGYLKCTRQNLLREAERLKGIYTEDLKRITKQKKGGSEGEDVDDDDDDATEVMSDVDSQETVDYNSEDTVLMDAEAVEKATHNLLNKLTRTYRDILC